MRDYRLTSIGTLCSLGPSRSLARADHKHPSGRMFRRPRPAIRNRIVRTSLGRMQRLTSQARMRRRCGVRSLHPARRLRLVEHLRRNTGPRSIGRDRRRRMAIIDLIARTWKAGRPCRARNLRSRGMSVLIRHHRHHRPRAIQQRHRRGRRMPRGPSRLRCTTRSKALPVRRRPLLGGLHLNRAGGVRLQTRRRPQRSSQGNSSRTSRAL